MVRPSRTNLSRVGDWVIMGGAGVTGRLGSHDIEMRSEMVIKRYRSWHRREPEREWSALTLLAEHAPGLAPMPLEATLDGEAPVVMMSRLDGVPLAAPLTAGQVAGLVEAIATFQEAIPRRVLMELPPRAGHTTEFLEQVRASGATRPRLGPDPLVRQAYASALDRLARLTPYDLVGADAVPVLGTGDGNLANYLWDGSRVRFIDFEHSGRSDRAFELAEVTEHISVGVARDDVLSAVLAHVGLTVAEKRHFRNCRLLHALYWLFAVLPDSPSRARNPPGTLERQAARLLTLLD
jgi:Ser/Thr protein kinase RdoA (MazF antagonist)